MAAIVEPLQTEFLRTDGFVPLELVIPTGVALLLKLKRWISAAYYYKRKVADFKLFSSFTWFEEFCINLPFSISKAYLSSDSYCIVFLTSDLYEDDSR